MPRAFTLVCAPAMLVAASVILGCAGPATPSRGTAPSTAEPNAMRRVVLRGATGLPLPSTRAERTNYRESSLHADVITFVDSLVKMGAPIATRELARSPMGKVIPLLIASRPRVNSPLDARRLGRPIVYVQANARGDDVEGKEAMLALLRDWSFSSTPNVLDSIVVIVVPVYDADDNDRLATQSVNRSVRQTSAMMGERAKSDGVDLTSDYVKADAAETRGTLIAFNAWDPDLFLDLRTTESNARGVALTYASALHPAAPLARYTADTLLTELRRRLRTRHKLESGARAADAVSRGATSPIARNASSESARLDAQFDHRPRFGVNYYGVRGRISVVCEAVAYDPLSRRVATIRAFVQEALSLVAERRAEIREHVDAGVAAATFTAGNTRDVAIRGRLVTNRFVSAQSRAPTLEGYLLDGSWIGAARLLRAHGVTVTPLERPMSASLQIFEIDSVASTESSVTGHKETAVTGRWRALNRTVPAGTLFVRMATPRDLLAMLLLEPESDDGLLTWNAFDAALGRGKEAPVVRLTAPLRLYSPGKSASTR